MNQKDYKEIDGIIKECIKDSSKFLISPEKIVNDLADYFDKKPIFDNDGQFIKMFNLQQFLKDCGVE